MRRFPLVFAAAALLAGCATPVATPELAPVTAVLPEPEPTVPPVPQPPERPVAPTPVVDASIPQAQREAAFVDYAAATYGLDPGAVRATLAQAQFQQ
jgi:membrane-bound lytic murein transglycosylase B